MDAKIIAIVKLKGMIATHWQFDFTVENSEGRALEGTITLDEAIAFANRVTQAQLPKCAARLKPRRRPTSPGSLEEFLKTPVEPFAR
jgi:hypothetical protein